MNYRPTDTLREVIFKTLVEAKVQGKVRDLLLLAGKLANHIEDHPELIKGQEDDANNE